MNKDKLYYLEKVIEEQYANTSGILIMKNANIVYEKYFDGYTTEDMIHIASVTKSVISILIGIAIDKGYIESVNQKVLDFFPNYKIKRGEKTIQNVTIKRLLTMTAPYKYKSEPYTKVYTSGDWTEAALDLLGGKSDSGVFKYSTVGTQILSGILTSATGESVLDFATKNLFEPLEIKVEHNMIINSKEKYFAFLKDKYVSGWVVDPKGANTAGWGLALTLRDMLKIGQLYLNTGKWNDKQILSSKWVENSTKENSRWGNIAYGYLWWIVDDYCYAALGDGGNVIFINTEKEMVVAIASRFMPRAKDRIEFIKNNIMTLFIED